MPFYFVYIWALILTTRALLIDPSTSEVQVLPYTSKQIFGFFMIIIYILSNSLFEHFVEIAYNPTGIKLAQGLALPFLSLIIHNREYYALDMV